MRSAGRVDFFDEHFGGGFGEKVLGGLLWALTMIPLERVPRLLVRPKSLLSNMSHLVDVDDSDSAAEAMAPHNVIAELVDAICLADSEVGERLFPSGVLTHAPSFAMRRGLTPVHVAVRSRHDC
jgi:hypothetical protein